ncbi:Serine/threonine-protein kinase N [Melipona quadrifasciata]|uniref:Serine/threonine-protein kinase N n=1 Tax=Melipona quadrifasciata TaxID=166423 RepID=A0A0M9A7V4_9HYME|nr:Serine/threonine-protein kinase N [Melipona quadrifasciata]
MGIGVRFKTRLSKRSCVTDKNHSDRSVRQQLHYSGNSVGLMHHDCRDQILAPMVTGLSLPFLHPVYELSSKYGVASSDQVPLPARLDELREHIRREIRKELKIKAGAEKLREVATDRKALSDVATIVKKSNSKLNELQAELQQLESQIILTQGQPQSPQQNHSNGQDLENFFPSTRASAQWLSNGLGQLITRSIARHLMQVIVTRQDTSVVFDPPARSVPTGRQVHA